MTSAERRNRGTKLCGRLMADVAKAVPKGIGTWPPAWEMVGDADAEFMLQLLRWERSGTESDKTALRAAYAAVLEAWRATAAEWEATRA